MAGKSVRRRLWRTKLASQQLLLLLVGPICCSVALVADDVAGTQRSGSAGIDHDAAGPGQAATDPAGPRQVRWATAAHEHLLVVDCQRPGGAAGFATARECSDLRRVDRRRWNVYLADPLPPSGSGGRRPQLQTVLPDGPLGDHHHHRGGGGGGGVDGVVALDPYPDANFGHLVVVFHVTIAASAAWCQRRDGFLIGN